MSILLVLLIGRLWIGNGSFVDIWYMEEQIEKRTTVNEQKKVQNRMLEAEIGEFKQSLDAVTNNGGVVANDAAIMERARTEFGMIKRNETFYQVILKPEELEGEDVNKRSAHDE